ncbi:hypothetical protein RIF23_12895 [Lipingzhangella sp. LS1_29]|uniref:Membrane protein DUF2127 n=1 Tax=Lipingzhangella rawalii TaxID=2055835 RepID=A0ABU2H7B4_9ACTN|nr:hypothetical protein [Lipingzhangella rawalii]MDS1271193.1 hypothetical protein [Lipingzhangella rawalii]
MSTSRPAPAVPRNARPRSITAAVWLMVLGATISLTGSVLSLLRVAETTAELEQDAGFGPGPGEEVGATTGLSVAVGLTLTALLVGTWLLMALLNARGYAWARGVATVLFCGYALLYVIGLGQAATALSLVLDTGQLLVGLAVVVLLWRGESTLFYDTQADLRRRHSRQNG